MNTFITNYLLGQQEHWISHNTSWNNIYVLFSSFHLFILLCLFKRKQNCQNICLICILLHAQNDAMFTYSKNFKWAVEEICVYFVAVACCRQSPSKKVLWRALFMKQNLTFGLVWPSWQFRVCEFHVVLWLHIFHNC